LRIHRSHPDEQFAIIPNATLRDHRLSALARSILFDLLSHGDGWETNADSFWRMAQKAHGDKIGEGRRAHRSAFAELEKYGYLVRRKVRDQRGRFVTVVHLYDTPGHTAEESAVAQSNNPWAEVDQGATVQSAADGTLASGTCVSGTLKGSTDQRSTEEEVQREEHSSALADARAAALAARRKSQLDDLYEAVNRLGDQDLRNALLTFEQRRPQIYRECRNDAIDQIKNDDPRDLKGPRAVRLSVGRGERLVVSSAMPAGRDG
jgi:hypothetical protein